ncbi:MAG: hypothetical protein LAT61_06380 [Alcanivorax sp.]|nr:hypothetical protein [Alcanivorax sp.]
MRLALLFVALALTACATPLPNTYEDVEFYITSQSSSPVLVEFYSQHRNAAWPGGGQAYVIRDYEQHRFGLHCRSTEQICYGAWVEHNSREYWGVGKDDAFGCDNCCMTCRDGNKLYYTLHD